MSVITGQCELDDAPISMKALRDAGTQFLTELLVEAGGREAKSKILVLDPNLAGPLGLVVVPSVLKELGVDDISSLARTPPSASVPNIVYLTRPEVSYIRMIAQHVKFYRSEESKHPGTVSRKIFVHMMPRRRLFCEKILEDEGVIDVILGEYSLDLIPMDLDVLSMELPRHLSSTYIQGDTGQLYDIARSLFKLQTVCGVIPRIFGLGPHSKLVAQMLLRFHREFEAGEPQQILVPEISRLILIDRSVDMITPLCTQLTYEGLVDEVFGIKNGTVDLPARMIVDIKQLEANNRPLPGPDEMMPKALNSYDKLFADVRDLNFAVVGPALNQKAKMIDEHYKERHNAKTVQELRDFMGKLKGYQKDHSYLRIRTIVLHNFLSSLDTNVAESVIAVTRGAQFRSSLDVEQNLLAGVEEEQCMRFIEDSICRQEPLVKVLRLLGLYSLTCGGIAEKKLAFLKREIVQTYGFKHLFTLENLIKVGLLKTAARGNNYQRLRQTWDLIVEDLNEQKPTDMAYVYSGYAPLSCRIIQRALEHLAHPVTAGTPAATSGAATSATAAAKSALSSFPSITLSSPFSSVTPTPVGATNPAGQRPAQGLEMREFPSGWGDARIDQLLSTLPANSSFNVTQTLPKGFGVESSSAGAKQTTLVCFIGGCTFTEISALRFLSRQLGGMTCIPMSN